MARRWKRPGCWRLRSSKGVEEDAGVFFRGETADVEEEDAAGGDAEFVAGGLGVVGLGLEDGGIDAEIDVFDVFDAPLAEERAEGGGGDEGAGEAAVEIADVAAAEVHDEFCGGGAEEFADAAEVGLGEMGVVKADDGDAEGLARRRRLSTRPGRGRRTR